MVMAPDVLCQKIVIFVPATFVSVSCDIQKYLEHTKIYDMMFISRVSKNFLYEQGRRLSAYTYWGFGNNTSLLHALRALKRMFPQFLYGSMALDRYRFTAYRWDVLHKWLLAICPALPPLWRSWRVILLKTLKICARYVMPYKKICNFMHRHVLHK